MLKHPDFPPNYWFVNIKAYLPPRWVGGGAGHKQAWNRARAFRRLQLDRVESLLWRIESETGFEAWIKWVPDIPFTIGLVVEIQSYSLVEERVAAVKEFAGAYFVGTPTISIGLL